MKDTDATGSEEITVAEGGLDLIARHATGSLRDAINLLECFISGGGNNRTGWENAEYDDKLARAVQETERAKRHALYQQAEAILIDELPIIPIYHYTRPMLIQPEVRDYHSNILAYFAYHKVWFDKSESGE